MRLQDKVIIVTGSTTGIGEAIARKCVAEGARVVVHGRDRARAEAVADSLGDRAVTCVADIADVAAPKLLVDTAIENFGRLDGVVNNAAKIMRADLDATDATVFDAMMAVNVRGPLLLIKAARPHLRKTQGCAINVGSINGYGGESNLLPYSVSKGALYTLSRNLADALSYEGVRIYHFVVGWVLTDNEYRYKVEDGLPKDWPEQLPPELKPSGSLLKPSHIANVAAFFLSDDARPLTGTTVELEQYPFLGRNPTKKGEEE